MENNTIILSLGGSLIVPDEVDVEFVKRFKELILRHTKTGKRFAIIAGGGKTCRKYNSAAAQIADVAPEDLDWLGIQVTKVNAQLIRAIFGKEAHEKVIDDPTKKIETDRKIILAAGWNPGCSTDRIAVLLAKNLGVKTIVNLTNIDYVYDRDPRKFSDAKIIKKISWRDFRKIVGDKWDPGLNAPFDPVASKEAEAAGIKVIIANGKNIENLNDILSEKEFKGTTIQ